MPRNTTGLRRGGPGRPKGVPNKVTLEAKAFCRSIIDDPRYRASLLKRARAGRLAPAVETMLWHYAKGKPAEETKLTVEAPLPLRIELTDATASVPEPGLS